MLTEFRKAEKAEAGTLMLNKCLHVTAGKNSKELRQDPGIPLQNPDHEKPEMGHFRPDRFSKNSSGLWG